jgi:hypothetical protein
MDLMPRIRITSRTISKTPKANQKELSGISKFKDFVLLRNV